MIVVRVTLIVVWASSPGPMTDLLCNLREPMSGGRGTWTAGLAEVQ